MNSHHSTFSHLSNSISLRSKARGTKQLPAGVLTPQALRRIVAEMLG